ncbi:hypothetical protein [Shewanella sp. Scap07]|uniref:hypothetical protein n=1 Tax=Shewanella sp. Scap07 TaxID=2589987 RepID=UPI001C4BDFAB|nr:hypothetical protein [Shewanella sp. Scap07]
MKLIANGINSQYFQNILPPVGTEIDEVVAAIAYGDDKTSLAKHCVDNKNSSYKSCSIMSNNSKYE